MDIERATEKIREQALNNAPFGAKLKFVIDDQPIYLDGTGAENVVTNDDNEADCVISASGDNFLKLMKGEINPMMAVMTGKVKIKGDMGVAMKLKSLMGG
jgi:putative sterol carrier protein